MKNTARSVLAIALTAMVIGPASVNAQEVPSKEGMAGKIQDGKYFSPNQKLVLLISGIGSPQHTRRDIFVAELDRGYLEEADIFSLRGIYYTDSAKLGVAEPKTSEERRVALEKCLRGFAMANIFAPAAPRSELVHQEFVEVNGAESLLALIRMPEMSGAFDAKTGKKYDAYPSILVLLSGRYAIVIRTQSTLHETKDLNASRVPDLQKWIPQSLQQLRTIAAGIELKQ